MTDPVDGLYGQLIFSGWIGDDPRSDQRLAFVYLGTPGGGTTNTSARDGMRWLADELGLNPEPRTVLPRPTADTYLAFADDGWARLYAPNGEYITDPVNQGWRTAAVERREVMLVLTYLPLPPGIDTADHLNSTLAAGELTMALVPVHSGHTTTARS
ncbi:hypothetical protein GCM10010174_25970 [Kutzneria viridogrisea]|uniref:Uncharacterized protein n=1 Tax=Kutzneria viridogrisea TaxID=47990 RepID=A0ABR6BRH2_9PSEU|nr:hypothetical protein [Kutzneria viridogrisea]